MYKFSKRSRKRLDTCHPDLIRLCEAVIKEVDISILEGHRGEDRQNLLYEEGYSTVRYPHSRHNSYPSHAVDIAFYPIDWFDKERWKELGRFVKQVAEEIGVEIEWGGDWQTFQDMPHFQLKRQK